MPALPVPERYRGVIPYLCCQGAAEAIEFYRKAFGATELMRLADPSGKVGHAEITIAGTTIMLSDEFPEHGARSPKTIGGSPVTLSFYVPDVDAAAKQAVAAGATLLTPPADQFYGDRTARLMDPYGHSWHIAMRIEEVSPEEMQRRSEAMYGSQG